eukprot:COSAG02_NODE_64191_length_261_cov_0.641975_1_plen_29_part_10
MYGLNISLFYKNYFFRVSKLSSPRAAIAN